MVTRGLKQQWCITLCHFEVGKPTDLQISTACSSVRIRVLVLCRQNNWMRAFMNVSHTCCSFYDKGTVILLQYYSDRLTALFNLANIIINTLFSKCFVQYHTTRIQTEASHSKFLIILLDMDVLLVVKWYCIFEVAHLCLTYILHIFILCYFYAMDMGLHLW